MNERLPRGRSSDQVRVILCRLAIASALPHSEVRTVYFNINHLLSRL